MHARKWRFPRGPFRAYDPHLGCATHSLPGHLPLAVQIFGPDKQLLRQLKQG